MLALLPISCWFLLWLSLSSRENCWRKPFLQACVIWATFAVVIVEGLSVVTVLNQTNVAIAWAFGLVYCVVLAAKSKIKVTGNFPELKHPKTLIASALVVSLLGLVALWCAPNNYDSLTYHLTRIEHWIVNKSVAHYPIHVLRQLSLNPGAEYLLLNFRLLANSDLLSNSLQWFSMLGCLIGTSLIAKKLGADSRGQVLASIVCLTIPIGLLESTSTQNDYVASFWLVCAVSFCLEWVYERSETRGFDFKQAIWLGLSLGLGSLTKATIYFFAAIPMTLLAVSLFKRLRMRALMPLLLTGVLSLVMSVPFMARNIQTFGTPLVNRCIYEPGYRAANDSYAPQYLISNVMRSFASELQAPVPIWNKIVFGGVKRFHEILHWDVSDPKSTFDGITFESVHPGFMFQEDIAGNPIHTVLFLIAVVILFAAKAFPKRRLLLLYGFCVVSGFVLFNCALKWQPWHSRLLLPLYVASSALVGCVLGKQSIRISSALTAALFVYSIPYLLINPNKLLIGNENIFATRRDENCFRSVPNFYEPYLKANDFFEQHRACSVGVASDDTSWAEYPLWVLLSRSFARPVKVEGLSLAEWTKYPGQPPDVMISYDRKPPAKIVLPSVTFTQALKCDSSTDRINYHFFGKEVGKSYNHLSMMLYLPEAVGSSNNNGTEDAQQ